MRVLVVDDDYFSRLKIKTLLSSYGDCDAVPDGDLALRMYKKAYEESVSYDLVTLDIDMPGSMSGMQALEKMREFDDENKTYVTNRQAKVLMVTALSDVKHVMESFRNNCDAFISKPVSPEKLRNALVDMGLI